jgi:hypothetical protein
MIRTPSKLIVQGRLLPEAAARRGLTAQQSQGAPLATRSICCGVSFFR